MPHPAHLRRHGTIALAAGTLACLTFESLSLGIVPTSLASARGNAVSSVPWNVDSLAGTAVRTTQIALLSYRRMLPRRQVLQQYPAADAATVSPLLPVVDQPNIQLAHRLIADRTLKSLPSLCSSNVRNFYVRYAKGGERGLGGEHTIIVSGNVGEKEFSGLIIHECGHVVSIGGLRGNVSSGTTSFFDGNQPIYADNPVLGFYRLSWSTANAQRPGSRDRDFVSGYAKTDCFEDFAETFAYYALQNTDFRRLAQMSPVLAAKYNWLRDNVFGDGGIIAQGQYVRQGAYPPWDVTKLPY